ncbi:MAG: hypothetical protein EZS28_012965 [Streblomastix strix]|uniref:Uncharacterized protein n=1 Tax=Streblomastix strix TaxID=222440 RepID=A0A5J4WAW0_9EUKA|nr:MAG: hypothetical protein EZS28_012965 [Streblomastix strix]
MEQLEGLVKENLQFTRRSELSELGFTQGLALQIRNAQYEFDKAKKEALNEANKANIWYLRTVERIIQSEVGVDPDLTRPKLSVIPNKVEETECDTVVTIDRINILDSSELTL